jgi:lantibiotic modifying enzyme
MLKIENSNLQFDIIVLKKLLKLYSLENAFKAVEILCSENIHEGSLPSAIPYLNRIEKQLSLNTPSRFSAANIFADLENKTCVLLDKMASGTVGSPWQSLHSTNNNTSINTGISGLILGLILMSRNPFGQKNILIDRGLDYLQKVSLKDQPKGLFSGKMGVALTLALGGAIYGNKTILNRGLQIALHTDYAYATADLFNGKAGTLFALSLLYTVAPSHSIRKKAARIYQMLVEKQTMSNGIIGWEDKNKQLTGAAHGSAGIAMSILLYGKITGDQDAIDLGIKIMKSLFSGIAKNGSLVYDARIPGSTAPVFTWCHGLEGILWCLLFNKEYIGQLEEEIDYCVIQLFSQHNISNASFCHGLSGQLELWKMVSSIEKYKYLAAEKINELLYLLHLTKVRHQGIPTWHSDEAGKISPDLWVGFMGPHVSITHYFSKNTESFLSEKWIKKFLPNEC